MDVADVGLQVLQMLWLWLYGAYCVIESVARTFIPRNYLKKDIKGKTVLITGGGSGIGRILCHKFSEHGARVVTWDVDNESNLETARQVEAAGGSCQAYRVDLCDRKNIYETAAKVKEEIGKVDILVNNAGVVTGKPLVTSPDHEIIRTFEVNSLSIFWTVKAFIGDMLLANDGHLVTVSSMAGWLGKNGMVDYCASKFAAVGFDESLRMELRVQGATNVKTTVVCPTCIDTGMFEGAIGKKMSPDWVASEIVDGTLMDVPLLMLPQWVRVKVIMKLILPDKLLFKMASVSGMTKFMDGFVGRQKKN